MISIEFFSYNTKYCRCVWSNIYRCRVWNRRAEFEFWTLILLRKACIYILFLYLWINNEADWTIYVVPSISFQTFFVQAFKIIVDSWKFSILVLYILWDDWSIFMIPGSNELLQQQLEYTLLKPDCHSWWISNMQSRREEERYAIKLCFKHGKKATETYGMLQTAFGVSCRNRVPVFEWHKRFKEGRESVRDDERCGRSKEVRTPELIGQRVRVRVIMFKF